MNIQHQRILTLCEQLNLLTTANQYNELALQAAEKQLTYADFLEKLLQQEMTEKQLRSRLILTKMAGFPAIKTLDEFDFTFAAGV